MCSCWYFRTLPCAFYISMTPLPPKSTLFPLHDALPISLEQLKKESRSAANTYEKRLDAMRVTAQQIRSEEHTSELQSRRDLVCRLLLEKKKKDSRIESNGGRGRFNSYMYTEVHKSDPIE